jgi:hypothetical protein
MTTIRQIEANRRNALKSTGPVTDEGKQRSRRNAVRHGLTAETVIANLEDAEDYKAFELAVTSGFDAPTAVERELVLRLASLLWRLRRATAIETGLIKLQHDVINSLKVTPRDDLSTRKYSPDREEDRGNPPGRGLLDYRLVDGRSCNVGPADLDSAGDKSIGIGDQIARCFLRLSNVDNGAFERAKRYETSLWRQVGQILLTLDFLRRFR